MWVDEWLEILESKDVSASNYVEVEVEARLGNTEKYFFCGVGGWPGWLEKLGLKLTSAKVVVEADLGNLYI